MVIKSSPKFWKNILAWFQGDTRRFWGAMILLGGLVAYGPTLAVGFLWDDHEMIQKNHFIKSNPLKVLSHSFSSDVFDGKGDPYYRPLQTILNSVDYAVWGLNPLGFHLTNLLFHLLGSIFLFLILRKILDSESVAGLTALFFAIHPIGVEQLLIIAGRAEIMAFAFTLGALLLALKGKPHHYGWSVLFYFLACFSKESGIIFPLYLVLIGFFSSKHKLPWKWFIPYAGVALLYLVFRSLAVGPALSGVSFKAVSLYVFRELPFILTQYLRILLFPFDLHSHRRIIFSIEDIFVSYVVITLLAYSVLRARSRVVPFSFGLFLLGLLPKLPLGINNSLMLDHWAYPSVVGILLMVSFSLIEGWGKFPRKKWGAILCGVLLLIFWGKYTWANIKGRNTDKKMYEWALQYPSSSVVRYNLGFLYYSNENYSEAQKLFEESLQINPTSALSGNGLALVRWKQGDSAGALQILDEWIQKNPQHAQSFINRAIILGAPSGIQDLERAISLNSDYENAWLHKAKFHSELKENLLALNCYKQVLRINSKNVEALVNAGFILAQEEKYDGAKDYWKKALELEPQNLIIQHNLNWVLDK